MPDYIAIPYMVCYNIEKERTWNTLFSEQIQRLNVYENVWRLI